MGQLNIKGQLKKNDVAKVVRDGEEFATGLVDMYGNPLSIAGQDGNTILSGTVHPTTEEGGMVIFILTQLLISCSDPKPLDRGQQASVWLGKQALMEPTVLMVLMGFNGVDGKTILYGTAAPTTEGADGDFYIRITTNHIYGPRKIMEFRQWVSLVDQQVQIRHLLRTRQPARCCTTAILMLTQYMRSGAVGLWWVSRIRMMLK